jgi:hypothetical protein
MITILIAVLFVAGILVGAYAIIAPRRAAGEPTLLDRIEPKPVVVNADWSIDSGQTFSSLSEAGRCALIFAVAPLGDERSKNLLVRALDDPSETVALAAAHALAASGCSDILDDFLQRHAGDRATRISRTLSLLRKPEPVREPAAAG